MDFISILVTICLSLTATIYVILAREISMLRRRAHKVENATQKLITHLDLVDKELAEFKADIKSHIAEQRIANAKILNLISENNAKLGVLTQRVDDVIERKRD